MHNSCLSGNGCDLSEYLAGRGPLQGQIYNPRVIDPKTGPAPFANNFIPNQYLSPQSLYLLKLIPLPNAPGTQNGTANNYNGGGNGTTNQNQFDVRVDYQIKEAAHAFGRYSYFDNKLADGTVFGAGGGAGFGNTFGGSAAGRNQSAVAGVDLAITPKLLTDFRLGYLRYHVATQKFDGAAAFAHRRRHPRPEYRHILHRRSARLLPQRWPLELRFESPGERLQLRSSRNGRPVPGRQ